MLFCDSSTLRASAKSKAASGKASPAQIVSQLASYAETLARKSSPTLLYHAPAHTAYIFGSYAFGFFCLTYAGFNLQHFTSPGPGLAKWVSYAFGGICIFMAGFGTWLILGPARIIRSITALPLSTPSTTAAAKSSPLSLRIELLPIVPLLTRPRYITASNTAVSLSNRLYNPLSASQAGSAAAPNTPQGRREAYRRRKEEIEYDREHYMTIPIRHMGRGLSQIFTGFRKVWTKEGFTKVTVDGRSAIFLLDGHSGWSLDDGRGIDRVVRIRDM